MKIALKDGNRAIQIIVIERAHGPGTYNISPMTYTRICCAFVRVIVQFSVDICDLLDHCFKGFQTDIHSNKYVVIWMK